MTCYLQLQDGTGFLQLQDGSGNLLLETCDEDNVILLGGTPAGPNVNPNAPGFFYELPYDAYQREQAALSAKQEVVISLKVEAQDNLMQQRELRTQGDKQSARQLKALEREQTRLLANIREAIVELEAYKPVAQKNLALLILIMSCPYLKIGGSTMH